ncbi:hypothetical protein [Hydrogenophaga sp.]|uniref:hypothetical protein n=1 Tax=Hydrogenophaga sp. TaxID=1904254 RepID=UPI0027246424|nr:hypothetical protein [Hydrogenophaga sp.]MDO9437306.1 hypothetical protein [Hydrogenophaga sp.]
MTKGSNQKRLEERDMLCSVQEELRHEAARLLRYFRALSPKNQSLAVRLLNALWKTQGSNTSA